MGDNFLSIFDLIAIGCGGYCIFTYIKLRIAGRLIPNGLLVPKEKQPKDCIDEGEYLSYIMPRLLILGIIVLVFGLISLANQYLKMYGLLVSEILTGISFISVVWYAVCSSRANKKYW